MHLKFESRFFLALLLSIVTFGVAASIGSGWALFLSCSALGAAVLSLFVPLILLSQLQVKISGPAMVDAGDKFPVSVKIESSPVLMPLLQHLIVRIQVDESLIYPGQSALNSAYYVPQLSKQATILSLESCGLKRGIRALPAVSVETSFPFGLVWVKSVFSSENTKLVVLPKAVPVEGAFLKQLRSDSYVPGDSQNSNHGFQTCYARGIREYNRTDSRRHIHWSVSARHGRLMVKEFENEGIPVYDVAFDLGALWQNSNQFELAISAVASLLAFGHSQGIHPELFVLNKPMHVGDPLPGRSVEIQEQLLTLAAAEQVPKGDSSLPRSEFSAFDDRARALIIVTPFVEMVALESIAQVNKVLLPLPIAGQKQDLSNSVDEQILSCMEDLSCL